MKCLCVALAVALLWPSAGGAQTPTPAAPAPAATVTGRTSIEIRGEEVAAMLNGAIAPEDLFTKAFLAAVPASQVKALSASIVTQFGKALSAEVTPRDGTRASIAIRLERGIVKGTIGIVPEEENRVGELVFTQVDSVAVEGDTPQKIAADLAALPGSVNAWFGPLDGAPIIAIGADKPLALGSTFKLYVLAALAEDVRAGRRRWSDVVPLTQKSYPSGRLQDWPNDAPLTLHTLASMMISISDNTATDQLIAVLGRDRILKLMRDSGHTDPSTNDPFLTTREFFLLKAAPPEQLAAYRRADAAGRRAILSHLAPRTLDEVNASFARGPQALDIEYFASPADLARLLAYMRRTADAGAFAILGINPSATPSVKAQWDYIGFKGGSEPGVINLTWLLTDKAGRDHVLTLGWNNPATSVEDGELEAIAQRILLLPR